MPLAIFSMHVISVPIVMGLRYYVESNECVTKDQKRAKLASSDVCRVCGVNLKILVRDLDEKNNYISTENLFKIPERIEVVA